MPGTHIWTPPYDPYATPDPYGRGPWTADPHGAPAGYGTPGPYGAPAPYAPGSYGPAPYGPAGQYGAPYGWAPPPRPATNGMAIASLVCAVVGIPTGLGLVLGPVAVVLGVVGLGRADREGNRGVAIAGIIVGALESLVLVLLLVLLFGFAGIVALP